MHRTCFVRTYVLFLLLLVPLLQLTAQETIPQVTVSLRVAGKPLHEVLDDLSAKTGYYFTFDARLVDSRRAVTLELENRPLPHILDTLFRDTTLRYQLVTKNIVIYAPATRQAYAKTHLPQDTIIRREVRGVVRDNRSGNPLPYATVALPGTHLGTITNQNGIFSMKLPTSMNQPVLVVSYMGYRNQYYPVNDSVRDHVTIEMDRNMISLQEVIIRYKDPVDVVADCVEQIPENYLDQPSGMVAYYRESVQRNKKVMFFSEAVVEINKSSYANPHSTERIKLLKGRKITDVSEEDTVLLKIRAGVNTALALDVIENPPDFLDMHFHERYKVGLVDVVSFKNKLVYVINFYPRDHAEEALFKGNLYIDQQSMALVAADFAYDPVKIGREQSRFVVKKSRRLHVRPVSAEYHMEYRESNGRYHLSQVQGEARFRVRKKRQWIGSTYAIQIEMAVTDVAPGKNVQVSLGEALRPNVVLSEEQFEYDPSFWGTYNTIAPETSLTEALQKIEKSMQEIEIR
mgnify:CR=1 FL=1